MANLKVQPVISDQISPEILLLIQNQNNLIRAIHAGANLAAIQTSIEVGGTYEVKVLDPHPPIAATPLMSTTEEA